MRNKLNKHPCLLVLFTILFIVGAFIGSNVVAGIQDRSSKVDLVPDPNNYIRLPNINKPSNFLRPDPRVKVDPITLLSGNTPIGQTGRGIFNVPPTGEIWLGNDEGNLAIAGKTVLIDDIDDLTFLSGGSGSSIFFMDWGNHYIIDFYSIQFSGGTENPIAGTTTVRLSGISGVFRSVLKKDDQKTITVEIAQTIPGGDTLLRSGDSIFQVWAPLNSGATIYGGTTGSGVTAITQGDSGTTTQTLNITQSENGAVVVDSITTVAAGGFDAEVQVLGDSKTWKANYLAGVSVTPIKKSIIAPTLSASGNIVLIDNVTDLSTWDAAASGSSYFQMEAGKTYVVDVQAINNSGAMLAFSAVTGHLPLATSASNLSTSKVIMANTGSLTGISSGTTTVQVWPAPLTGATQFRTTSTFLSQNMLGATTSGSSAFTVNVTGDVAMTHVGGTQEFMLFNNSAVSASPLSLPYNFGVN
ncbi:MAG TPA: hypothetical protein ENH82_08110 [bacterium]|nr:hypothetical protein [bacterium]